MSPVAGLVRLRKHLFGRQAVFGAKVAAKRAYPFSGTPDVELNWTDPETDEGSRDPVAAPHREAPELGADLDLPTLYYNDVTIIVSGFFGGGVTPTGAGDAKTWSHAPASETLDAQDPFTYQFGDDVLTDWFQLGDGIIESFEITGPDGLGALSGSATWRFGSVASTGSTDSPVTGTVPTPGLTVDNAGVPVYLKDCSIYIADDVASLDYGAQITNALYNFTLRGSQEIDEKRWANGDQSFDADELVPGKRSIEIEMTLAKTTDIVGLGSESDHWMSDVAVNRYLRLAFVSTVDAEYGIPYSWEITMPFRYYTRTEDAVGGNTAVVLTGHAFYDADDLAGVFLSELVNTLASAGL